LRTLPESPIQVPVDGQVDQFHRVGTSVLASNQVSFKIAGRRSIRSFKTIVNIDQCGHFVDSISHSVTFVIGSTKKHFQNVFAINVVALQCSCIHNITIALWDQSIQH
jgi:hypothetical protein